MYKLIALINGIYDVICSMCILKIINIPILNNLHLSVITTQEKNPLYERSFGFFVLTYGVIRIYGTVNLISLSYLIEILYYIFEIRNNNVVIYKAVFIIITCIVLWLYTRILFI
jgi:hypothetical protein